MVFSDPKSTKFREINDLPLVCGVGVSPLSSQEVVGEGLWALIGALKCLALLLTAILKSFGYVSLLFSHVFLKKLEGKWQNATNHGDLIFCIPFYCALVS